MKRVILAALLALFPAVAFAQDNPFQVTVPQLSLVPTTAELELLRQEMRYREWVEVQRDLPMYRVPLGGDFERELMWTTSPFASSIPVIVPFRF
jgi:hypothetical protein